MSWAPAQSCLHLNAQNLGTTDFEYAIKAIESAMEKLPLLTWVSPVYSHEFIKVGEPFPHETREMRPEKDSTHCSGFEFGGATSEGMQRWPLKARNGTRGNRLLAYNPQRVESCQTT